MPTRHAERVITHVAYVTENYRSAEACLQGITARIDGGWSVVDITVEGKRNYTVYFRKDPSD